MTLSKKKQKEIDRLETKDTKQCSGCKIVKPLYEFSISSLGRKFAYTHCFECMKEKSKGKHLIEKFGITLKDYDCMLKKQDGKCKICGTKKIKHKQHGRFCVDHNHKTNKIRGLLCHSCNSLLGYAKDDTKILAKAIQYLEENQ